MGRVVGGTAVTISEASRQAKIVAIREAVRSLEDIITASAGGPPVLGVARARLAKELSDRADRLERRLRIDQRRKLQ
jgi:hypothetical protein